MRVSIALAGIVMAASLPTLAVSGGATRSSGQNALSVRDHFRAADEAFYSSDWTHRFHLDIDGDGLDELFVSHDASGGLAAEGWAVYLLQADGSYRFYDSIGFHRYGFRLSTEPRGLDVYWRVNASSGSFVFYAMTEDGFKPVEGSGEIAADSEAAVERFDAMTDWRSRTKIVFYAAATDSLKRDRENWLEQVRQGHMREPEPPILSLSELTLVSPSTDKTEP